MKLAGGTDASNIIAYCSDMTEVVCMLYISLIYIHTQSTHLFFSLWTSSLFTSDERGGGGRKMAKRDREMREKGESWPLGLNEASSVSEGAGGWTKWLIHFPRDPLPPNLHSQKKHTQTHAHPLPCGWVQRSRCWFLQRWQHGLYWPAGSAVKVKGHGGIHPLSVPVCFWLWRPQAEPQEIWLPPCPAWPLVIFSSADNRNRLGEMRNLS